MNSLRFRGVSITREGAYFFLVFLFILAGAIVRNLQLLMILACMLLGPLLYNAWVVYRSLRNLKLTRRAPSLLSCGEVAFVELQIRNPSRSSKFAVVLEDSLKQVEGPSPEDPENVEVFFAKVPRKAEAAITYRIAINKRGKYRFGPLTASTAFPLGLMRSVRAEQLFSDVIVTPRLGTMTPAWRRLIQQEQSGFASSRRQHGLLEGDFYGLREWRHGDPKQWIHWRSSAKQGELVVRQFEKQSQQDFALIVDAWLPEKPQDEDRQAAERMISMAATIVRDLAAIGGCHLQLHGCAKQQHEVIGDVSQAFVLQAMSSLAVMMPSPRANIGGVLNNVLQKSKPGLKVIVLTTRDIQLSDSEVFVDIWNNVKMRAELGRVNVISAARREDDAYFFIKSAAEEVS